MLLPSCTTQFVTEAVMALHAKKEAAKFGLAADVKGSFRLITFTIDTGMH